MCGICGYVNYNRILEKNNISHQIKKIKKQATNEEGRYVSNNVVIGQVGLNTEICIQPIHCICKNNEYVIVGTGELYNKQEIQKELINKGHEFSTGSDMEVVLHSYIEYKENCLEKLNGVFALCIIDVNERKTFIARDRLGVKPVYYIKTEDNDLVFASEIKGLLAYRGVYPILDKEGVLELIGLGPAHTPGRTYFKNIYELKPGSYMYIDKDDITIKKYWSLKNEKCKDPYTKAVTKVRYLVKDSIKRQIKNDCNIGCMLSGGLDSSIITKVVKDNISELDTFSIDFIDNNINFEKNDYQNSQDTEYIKKMVDFLKTRHRKMEIDYTDLYTSLSHALIARDVPGMADIDSSMYEFCNKISETGKKVVLSGECSDEIFGGYPWLYKEELMKQDTFPWALSRKLRKNLINPSIDGLEEYINKSYNNSIKEANIDEKDEFTQRYKEINYLTISYFMQTLLERTERVANSNSLNVRVPFADYRIFEYVYNLPVEYKLGDNLNQEKHILRKAFEEELPRDIVNRKKNPFPKTYNPKYLEILEDGIKDILENKENKIFKIINREYIEELISTHGNDLKENFFGQLMTYPQLLAYIIQIDTWLEVYDIIIEI